MEQQQQPEEAKKRDDLSAPLALGTLGAATIGDLIIRGGWTGFGAGVLAAAFVYFKGTPYIRSAKQIPGMSFLLAERPKKPGERSFVDRLLNQYPEGYFDAKEQAQPHEDEPCVTEKAEQESVTQANAAPLEEMEGLAPNPLRLSHLDALTDDEIDEGLAEIMASSRHEEQQEAEGRVRFIYGSDPRRRLMMAENFQPDADAPLATGVAAFGLPGSGKTTTIVRFFEQYVEQFRLPFVAFDSQGDFKSLVESGLCPRGVIATPGNLPSMASVVKHRLQVVLDLSEWREQGRIEISYELAAQVIAASIRGLMAAQKAIPSHDRIPCLVGLDEAQLWVPEGASGLISRETQQSIKSVVMALATTGRKLGVVPFVVGPRIAQIDKDAIAGIETRLFGKADLDNDIKRYREYIPVKEVSDQQIRQLGQGELIVSMNGQRLLVHFYNRATVHTSHTPRVSRALAQMTSALPVETLAQITRAQETAREERKQTDPRLPVTQTRRHVSTSAYDARKKQLRDRRMPVRVQGTPVAQGRQSGDMGATRETVVVEKQDERDDRLVLEAYQSGKKSGGAITVATRVPANRVNYSLHRLAEAGKIDWQPRK